MEKYSEIIQSIEVFSLLAVAERVLGPYSNGNGDRKIVIIINDDGSRRTVSYPKYLMEKHLNKVLDKDEHTIDHIDRDHNNNDINNLRIVPRSQHSKDDTRRVKLIDLICNMCQKPFQRSPRLMRDKNKKGVSGIFCSRQCSGRYSRKLQLGLIEKFPTQPFMASEYYRNEKDLKPVEASVEHLILKYSSFI